MSLYYSRWFSYILRRPTLCFDYYKRHTHNSVHAKLKFHGDVRFEESHKITTLEIPSSKCLNMSKESILITGASGQVGTALLKELLNSTDPSQIIATDIQLPDREIVPFHTLDILDKEKLLDYVREYDIGTIYHLAAILSAKGEQNPTETWKINMNGLFNVLEVGVEQELEQIFFPSSIAVFGDEVDPDCAAQHAPLYPATVYGISKAAGENWCAYFHKRFGLDVRSLRFPGIISHDAEPGGGTTDYAVDIFHSAVQGNAFTCFLKKDAALPMIYMDDAIRATLELMDAPAENIRIRTSYNIQGLSFNPDEIYREIKKHKPDFTIEYAPDFRQEIAESWPSRLDDSAARADWNWAPVYDLENLVDDMLTQLENQNS